MQIWPPPYSIKRYKRAKSVKLHASKKHGLVVSLPWRMSAKHVPDILERNKDWIVDKLPLLQRASELPTVIALPALNEVWQVLHLPCFNRLRMTLRADKTIVLFGEIKTPACWHSKLINHLRHVAEVFLSQQLQQYSAQFDLPFNSLTIRDQLTRWGSCNRRGDINLNYKLIFLPYPLMRHVVLHELCHTKELNHSSRFWQLLRSVDESSDANKQALKQADQFIPAWI